MSAFYQANAIPISPMWGLGQQKSLFGSAERSIKLLPAFYWSTIGLEYENPLAEKWTWGINALYKFQTVGSPSSSQINHLDDFESSGIRIEAAVKHYFKKAPVGSYVQFFAGYNSILYSDGNTRPFPLLNRAEHLNPPGTPSDLNKLKPVMVGLGFGYQIHLVHQHVLANVMGGMQAGLASDNSFTLTFYLNPSVGISF